MRWPFRRRLYLTVDNDDSDPRPVGVEELLSPVLKRALMATKATGAAIALNRGKGHHHMPPIFAALPLRFWSRRPTLPHQSPYLIQLHDDSNFGIGYRLREGVCKIIIRNDLYAGSEAGKASSALEGWRPFRRFELTIE